jgi:putative ABC transport system permease protein
MWQDVRYALRLLGRQPGFAVASILTLTLGIGMTCAIFSVVDAVLLNPSPFPDADRLVVVWETDRDTGTSHEPGSWPDFIDFQEQSQRVEAFAGVIAGETTLTPAAHEPQRLAQLVVTRELLPMLGVTPILGRSLTADDERLGGPAIVLISEQLWDRHFARDPGVIGRTLRLDDQPRTIAGVVPSGADFGILQVLSTADYSRGFADRDARSVVEVWAPLQADPERLVRDTHPLLMLGRLAPGVTLPSAQDEMASIAADLERRYPSNRARGVFLEPLRDVIFGPSQPALLVLLAAVGVVLLISCVNVANLLLARGTTRRREVALRSALGADLRQLGRQFAVENLLLTTIASVLGLALAVVALRTLVLLAPPDVPRLAVAAIDGRVLALALALAGVVGCLFGLLPLIQSRRTNLQVALNAEDTRGTAGGRATSFARSSLVVAELSLAVVLVIGAGLLIKSFWQLRQIDPGFDASGVLKAQYQLPASRYPVDFQRWPDVPSVHRFNAALLARVGALPGVESAALAASHPLDAGFTNSFVIIGREVESRDLPEMSMRQVTPDYFRTLRIPTLKGRRLEERDAIGNPPVVLLNETAARRLFPAGDELGQQVAFWGARRTIVGVVGDERFHGVTAVAPMAAYLPVAQAPSRGGAGALLVRTTSEPSTLMSAVRGAFAEIDPALAVFGMEPLADTVTESIATQRFLMVLLALFAALALVLAAVGIHGVTSYAVAQRTREIGIRLALGASPQDVLGMVLGQVAKLTACGLGIGLALGVAFSQSLAGLLFGVGTTDAATYAGVLVMLGTVAMVAALLPLRRAVRVDPTVALRQG